MTAGVNAMLAAARGEYHGTGQTVKSRDMTVTFGSIFPFAAIFILMVLFLIFASTRQTRRGVTPPAESMAAPGEGSGAECLMWCGI